MRAWTPGFVVAIVASNVMACGGALPAVGPPVDARVAPVRLVHGGSGPEVDRALASLYGRAFAVADTRALAATALARHPDAGAAHEVVAYLATLADDPDEAWRQFWQAAQDLDAPLTELYLWELNIDPTRAQRQANLALLDALRTQHPSPTVRGAATLWQARTLRALGHIAEAEALVRPLGFLENWSMMGAFDNEAGKGFLTAYPPEQTIDFGKSVDGPLVPLTWREVPHPLDLGSIAVGNLIWPSAWGVAYLVTWVHADNDVDARLRISTGDAARAWVNGGLVLSEERVGSPDLDNLIVPVRLQRGWNQLLVKSAQKSGAWWLRARFTDPAGAPLAGLTSSAQPQPFRAQPAEPHAIEATPPQLADVAPANRRWFLTSRWLARGGHLREQQSQVQSFLDDAPANLLATYYLSLAYWAEDEVGKAIDLLNRGVERGRGDAPAFLHLRARYYQQRQLYEKAQADYRQELTTTGVARVAERDLAELLWQRGWRIDRCRQLEETARKWPDSAVTVRELGVCQVGAGYAALGRATLQQALALEPGATKTLHHLYDNAVDELRFADAHRWLSALQEAEPNAPGYLVMGAELARREGHPREAEAQLRAAALLGPVWARPHERLGDLLLEQRRDAEALVEWKLARARDPNNSVLSQRIEYQEPTRLGFIERYVPTADAIDEALRRKLNPHPGAQVALLLDHEVTEVNADGGAKRVVTLVSQALNEHGRDALIVYHLPKAGEAKILQAYSLSKTGERQEASSIRNGEVRFRNLDIGSRVVLQYVHYASAARFLESHYAATWYFRSPTSQNERPRWVLVLPKDRPLRVQVEGPVTLEDAVVGDRRVRIWSAQNASPLTAEPGSPPAADLLWHVSVSTVPDWDEYVRWERALLADAFRGSPKLDELAARLVTGASGPRDKLDRLFRYVTKDVRYQQDYENTIAGVRPHACPIVLERGYGDCKDKAVLLIHLAKLAGVKLQFALLRTVPMGKIEREVPNQQFNHAIVYAPAQPGIDKPIFLDPTSDGLDVGNLPAADQGATSLVLDPDSGAWEMIPIPFQSPDLAYSRFALSIVVKSPTETRADGEIEGRGGSAMMLRHVLRNKAVADKALQSFVAKFLPGTNLIHADWPPGEDTDRPVAIKLEMDASRAVQQQDDHFRFTLPVGGSLTTTAALERRETPLVLGVPQKATDTVTFTIPEGYGWLHTPADFSIAHPCFAVQRHSTVAGRTVTSTLDTRQTCNEISVEDYGMFRDRTRDLASKLRDEISFVKTPARTTAKTPARTIPFSKISAHAATAGSSPVAGASGASAGKN